MSKQINKIKKIYKKLPLNIDEAKKIVDYISNSIMVIVNAACGDKFLCKDIDDIISLLQQGEKNRLILKDLDRQYGHYLIGIKGNGEIGIGYTIRDFIEKVEQKYFPKEKSDVNNN